MDDAEARPEMLGLTNNVDGRATRVGRTPTYRGNFATTEAGELSITHALLRRAALGRDCGAVRAYSPTRPVVVFGRRDTQAPGFRTAVRAAERRGFDTAVRVVGGHVVAYTPNAVVLDVIRHDPRAADNLGQRFVHYGQRLAAALRSLGLDAGLGAVPGEYCPGAHSVNARGAVKLVGTAQRVVKNAWLFSALVVVDDETHLREVLTEVHAHLELPFDPCSVGSVREEKSAVTLKDVEAALARVWDRDGQLGSDLAPDLDPEVRDLARILESSHLTGR